MTPSEFKTFLENAGAHVVKDPLREGFTCPRTNWDLIKDFPFVRRIPAPEIEQHTVFWSTAAIEGGSRA